MWRSMLEQIEMIESRLHYRLFILMDENTSITSVSNDLLCLERTNDKFV